MRVERRGDAARSLAHDSSCACPYERGFLFEQRQRCVDRGMVCCEDFPRRLWFGESVGGADALGGGEHEVESTYWLELARDRDGAPVSGCGIGTGCGAGDCAAQPLAGEGWTPSSSGSSWPSGRLPRGRGLVAPLPNHRPADSPWPA